MMVGWKLIVLCFVCTTLGVTLGLPKLVNKNERNKIGHVEFVKDLYEGELGEGTNFPLQEDETITPENNEVVQDTCGGLPKEIVEEIAGYKATVGKIIEAVISGQFKGRTYSELGYFVDKYGYRLAGSDSLEKAIDYVLDKMTQDGLDNVHGEEVNIPHWVRGGETATLISPRKKNLALLGLGYTVGTPPEGITAPVLVVSSFAELEERKSEANGSIIVFNEDYKGYGESVQYRGQGAIKAKQAGGLAALVRSVTPLSINSPHTGMMHPNLDNPIPSACITVEDAELLHRLQKEGAKLVMKLVMNDTMNAVSKKSRNSVGEIKGREKPDEVVIISGHIDSWDVGQGAMDDGGGAFISLEALALLHSLNLRPRRTLRAVLWTAEEFGLIGASQYLDAHKDELPKINAVFESDIGTFRPLGLDFDGSSMAGCVIKEVLKLLAPLNATTFRATDDVGSDIDVFVPYHVPRLSLNNANENYFWFHHSEGDTMTVENADELDLCTAVWAVSSFVLADMKEPLERK